MTARLPPNAAVSLASLAVVWCLTLYDGPRRLFRDADTGWHIRTGESILKDGRPPYADPYSFSRPRAPWFAWEWGADVLTALAHRAAGLPGVAWLYAMAIGASALLWFELHWAAGSSFLLALLGFPIAISTAQLHWLARPHVFGWLLLIGTILWCERGPRRWWIAPVLGAVWANVHASFFLAPVVLAVYRRWTLAALALAGSFVNPYGWRLHEHTIRYLTNGELLQRIAEFQTFNFQADGAGWILAGLLVCAAGAAFALVQKRYSRAIVIALFVLVALRSARGLPVLAVCVLPLAVASISTWTRRAYPRFESFFRYSDNLRAIDRTLGGRWALVPVTLLAAFLVRGAEFPASEFPVAAARAIPETARLFAPDKFGGYLIYATGRPVFFDGRSDFYGVEFMKEYIRMVEVRPGWQSLFDRWNFTHALVPPDAPLLAALEARGWKRMTADPAAVLLEK